MKPSIAFQTSCYEKSYKHLLLDGTLLHYLSRFPDINFAERRVIINNIENKDDVKNVLQYYDYINYVFSLDNQEFVLSQFNLTSSDFVVGLYYSIQHFTGIYLTNCDYLFHASEDCGIDNLDSDFINESIEMLESRDDCIVALPRWCADDNAIEKTDIGTNKFFIQYGFTDQIYIIKTKIFKKDIYHYKHPASERYPAYGGDAFEKRVDSYMRCNQHYGIVHKNYMYNSKQYDNIIKGVR